MNKKIAAVLASYPVVIEIDVAWGDMDAFKHVNNTAYFRWFESGRIAYFRKVGFTGNDGVGPVLASTSCRMQIPLVFPDRVTIGARVREIGDNRFTMEYAVVSQTAGKVAAEGEAVVFSYNHTAKRTAPLPAKVRQQMEKLEKS
ncbi:MAG: acyl-CoA thioesterase [Pyrinomonadaceae bacterium]